MSNAEIKAHAMKFSQTYKVGTGIWKDHFEAMAKKTVLKLMLSKYAPLSIDMQKALEYDQSDGTKDSYPDNPEEPKLEVEPIDINKITEAETNE